MNKIELNLAGFTGGSVYRHPLFTRCAISEGGAYLCERGCAWLLDVILSYQGSPRIRAEDFQVWKIRAFKNSAIVAASDGNGRALVAQRIKFTDFPVERLTLWAVRNELGGVTVMLPSEY
jgi:hypothetical protein